MAKIAKKCYSGAFFTEKIMKNDVFSRFQSNFDQFYHNLYDSIQEVVKNCRENMFLRGFLIGSRITMKNMERSDQNGQIW